MTNLLIVVSGKRGLLEDVTARMTFDVSDYERNNVFQVGSLFNRDVDSLQSVTVFEVDGKNEAKLFELKPASDFTASGGHYVLTSHDKSIKSNEAVERSGTTKHNSETDIDMRVDVEQRIREALAQKYESLRKSSGGRGEGYITRDEFKAQNEALIAALKAAGKTDAEIEALIEAKR